MAECPDCGAVFRPGAAACPQCGLELPEDDGSDERGVSEYHREEFAAERGGDDARPPR